MQLKKGQIETFDVDGFAFGGRGIADFNGMKVFIDRAIPGDKVKASFWRIKKNYAEARLEEVLEESADRVKPRCKYSGVCGGCQSQFVDYQKQLEFKKQSVIDCMERIGEVDGSVVREVIGCEDSFFYRNKMEFTFGYDAEMNFALGLHLPGRRYDILDVDQCFLESERSVEILNFVRDFCLSHDWQPRKYTTDEGFLKSLFVREGKRTDQLLVNLMTAGDEPDDFKATLDKMWAELHSKFAVTSFYWSKKIAKRGQKTKIYEDLIGGNSTLSEKMIVAGDEMTFEILPQAFFQVNTLQGEKLYQEVVNLVEQQESGGVLLDLFCGTGTIGMFLAKHAEKVVGIDLNPDAIKVAKSNAEKNGVANIEFFDGDAFEVVREINLEPSIVVVDPPRIGLSGKLVEKIAEFSTSKIIYVSCNPASLARDCKKFAEFGYQVASVQPVDMFPHTYHIENVCLLEKVA